MNRLLLFIFLQFSLTHVNSQNICSTSEYIHFFDENTCCKNLNQYKSVLIIHFDFCEPDSYCGDTAKIQSLLSKAEFILIDTLYNSHVPDYVSGKNYSFVNRVQLQRKGLYHSRPILLRPRKTKIKLL